MATNNKKTTKYQVTFVLEVEGDQPEEIVEEAVAAVIDGEIHGESRRCGMRFHDAHFFSVEKGEG